MEFAAWIKGYLGEERAEYMAWLTNQTANWRKAEMDEIYEWLKESLEIESHTLKIGPNDGLPAVAWDDPPHMDLEWHWKKTA